MPDISKLLEKAEKLLQKQKYESALQTYREIHSARPNDTEVLSTLGDLYLKLGRTAEGLKVQSQLIDEYIRRNDTWKAVATCRRFLKLSPQDVSTLRKLGDLLDKGGRKSEALEVYRTALELYRKAGATAPRQECLEHILQLDPDDLEGHVELAELAAKTQQTALAKREFSSAAQLARAAGQEDRWAELAERAYRMDPADEAQAIALAEVHVKRDRAQEVVPLLEPVIKNRPEDLLVLELLTLGYLARADCAKAEPLARTLYRKRPEKIELLLKVARGFAQLSEAGPAMQLAAELRPVLMEQGRQNDYLAILEGAYEADPTNLEVLESLVALYDELNKEEELRRGLPRLFNLYLASEQYARAAETLEKIIDVDPYGEGHTDRLLNLEGHIDPARYHSILGRLQPPSSIRPAASSREDRGASATATETLEELIIEGEMYYQYQLSARLMETVEKINRLFPGAEGQNARLRELYESSGYAPQPPAGNTMQEAKSAVAAAPESPRPPAAGSAQSTEDLRKIADITAQIYREATPQGVMQVAVYEIGRALNASRCWGALGTVERAPALVAEYCAPAVPPSDPSAAGKVYFALMAQAVSHPEGWLIHDALRAQLLAGVIQETQALGIKSLLGRPLYDREMVGGLLLVEQVESPRTWTDAEALMLKAIATQVVIAVNNTRLRRLVRSLAGPDQETGLLPQSSYIDCLLSEASRAKELAQPLSLGMIEPDDPAALIKSLDSKAFQNYFRRLSRALLASLRSNDIAVRSGPASIALVLPDTNLLQGAQTLQKLRKVLSQVKTEGGVPASLRAVICDVPLGAGFDAVDAVTEAINRLESAMEQAHQNGSGEIVTSAFQGG
ncbi:MAG TPA: GAF domain-containing protein [Terriglobia bacterium]|nr:GAF domain-containing protein [Terriglobia bacterium]